MKIPVSQLQENKSFVLEEEISPEDLDLDIGVMHFPQNLKLRVEAWKTGDDLSVDAHVEGVRNFTCSLCLEEFDNLFEKDISLYYDIKGLESVNVDQDVRDEIILDHPIRVLCKPNCRGLCAFCGANLNEEACNCKDNE